MAESAQAIIEDANIAKALLIAGPLLWDALDASDAAAPGRSLRAGRRPARPRMTTGSCTRRFSGLPAIARSRITGHDRGHRVANARADDWYLGDGWYGDGPGHRPDYYSAWSFHFELVLIAWKTGDAERLKVLTGRLRSMCDSLLGLIGDDGSPVYWGRSLTYRFAVAAPLAALAVVDPATPNAAKLGIDLGRGRPTILLAEQ